MLKRMLACALLITGCAQAAPPAPRWVVQPLPAPTFTRQPVHGGTTDVLPISRPSPSRASRDRPLISDSSAAWASSSAAVRIAHCESSDVGVHGVDVNSGVAYYGKWQMNQDFWETYGGLRFAQHANQASEAIQDLVAYRGFLARGWQPWECARILGIYP